MTRRLLTLFMLLASCASHAQPPPVQPPHDARCPDDTRAVGHACIETEPVSRGAYRSCADANGACEAPPLRDYVAWGSDRAQDPMPAVPFASARAYCAHVGRRLPSRAEAKAAGYSGEWVGHDQPTASRRAFRCAASRGSPTFERPVATPAMPVAESVIFGIGIGREAAEWPLDRRALVVVDDAGRQLLTSIVFRKAHPVATSGAGPSIELSAPPPAGAAGILPEATVVWPALGGEPERTFSLEVRDSVLRFRDEAGDCLDDWAIGAYEWGGSGGLYVGGSPWAHEFEFEGPVPFRPLRAPCSRRKPSAFSAYDRALYVAQPDGKVCARAGWQVTGRLSPVLRVEASEGDRFFAVTDLARDVVFVSALDDASGEAGIMPTGKMSLTSSAKGYRIGDTMLYVDRAACRSALATARPPRPPDGEGWSRRKIFAAWASFVQARSEVFFVPPSGDTCERAALGVADGSPFIGTIGPYTFDIDGDGIHLAAGACREHYELTSYHHDVSFGVGSSKLFATARECEHERATTPPFAHRCTSRPPLPSGSLAARRRIDGFTRTDVGVCTPTSLEFRPSFAITSKSTIPPALDGVWVFDRKLFDRGRFDVIEWPYSNKMFIQQWKRWVPVEQRGAASFAIGVFVIHSTQAACLAAP